MCLHNRLDRPLILKIKKILFGVINKKWNFRDCSIKFVQFWFSHLWSFVSFFDYSWHYKQYIYSMIIKDSIPICNLYTALSLLGNQHCSLKINLLNLVNQTKNIAVVLPGSSIKIGGKLVMLFMSSNWIYKQRLLLYISNHLVSVVIKRTIQVKWNPLRPKHFRKLSRPINSIWCTCHDKSIYA